MRGSMLEQENWNTVWIERTIANMVDLERRGVNEVTLHVREFQHILMQLLAAHQRCDRFEDALCSYAKYAFPPVHNLTPPLMFGGDNTKENNEKTKSNS